MRKELEIPNAVRQLVFRITRLLEKTQSTLRRLQSGRAQRPGLVPRGLVDVEAVISDAHEALRKALNILAAL